MALTDAEKLAVCTAVLRGEPVARGDVILSMRDGMFIVHDTARSDPILYTHSWDEALFNFELCLDAAERAEEIAMEIYEGDARTHLTHGLCVEVCEIEGVGPSDEDEETEV